MRRQITGLIALAAVLFLMFTCFNSCKQNPYKIKVKDPLKLNITRFDKELFSIDPSSIEQKLPYLKKKYGDFFYLYGLRILNIGSPDAPVFAEYLQRFVTDLTINKAYNEVQQKFTDLSATEKEISSAWSHFKYYYPEANIPSIYTYISGFNHSIAVADSSIGIGLDKYLGPDHKFYERLGWPDYTKYNLRKEKIPSDMIKAFATTMYDFGPSSKNLINEMIYQGKVIYFTKSMLPSSPDSLIMGFSQAEMQFCKKHEDRIWLFLVEQKLLFSTDPMTINKYLKPAPFSKGLTEESPGQAALWVGWQIIEEFMRSNKNLSLKELMAETDYEKILRESGYSP